MLKHLVANANRVVTKEELLDAVWPGIAVTENSLSQCISEIRKAIGDEKQSLLKTVARRGYRFVPERQAPGIPHDRYPQVHGTASPDLHETKGRRTLILVSAVLAIVAAVAAFIWRPAFDTEVPTSLSIAVLPFANLSEAEEQAYLANGFADDLTTELARVPGLFVVSRNAARAYRNSVCRRRRSRKSSASATCWRARLDVSAMKCASMRTWSMPRRLARSGPSGSKVRSAMCSSSRTR
ncbi:winged helix-turn-helix domain-containing protein [Mesorhizobium sp.]|uniref:winged helix-turn-helix domain-containing protein n=1 Tax=Mesorhizobium sp. TaxID=1871066 RepID=UPI00257DE328|nr:winged helix-turn-helix domain-containing protein [Mesorhizobium sp.]